MVDHFQAQAEALKYGVAYIYFNYNEQLQQTPTSVLGSLIKQLAYQIPLLPQEIEDLYDRSQKNGTSVTLKELHTALLKTFKSFNRVFLIFDALDEYNQEQRKELLPLLHTMGENGANLFLTSRDHPEDIQHSFHGVPKVKISANTGGIKHYIRKRIRKSPRANYLIQQGNCEDQIISKLTDCAQGM